MTSLRVSLVADSNDDPNLSNYQSISNRSDCTKNTENKSNQDNDEKSSNDTDTHMSDNVRNIEQVGKYLETYFVELTWIQIFKTLVNVLNLYAKKK